MLADGRLMPQASDSPGSGEKRFLLELRSQASGDSTLLRCTSEVGRLDLRDDTAVLDELYELQRKLGHAKVCVHRDDSRLDRVTVEGDLPFSPALTPMGGVGAAGGTDRPCGCCDQTNARREH